MAEAPNNSSSGISGEEEDPIRLLVHDLRGQLSALLSGARLLELSPGNVEQEREVVAIIRRQVELLDRRIGQLGRAKYEESAFSGRDLTAQPVLQPLEQC